MSSGTLVYIPWMVWAACCSSCLWTWGVLCAGDSCADEIHVPGSLFLLAVALLSVKALQICVFQLWA